MKYVANIFYKTAIYLVSLQMVFFVSQYFHYLSYQLKNDKNSKHQINTSLLFKSFAIKLEKDIATCMSDIIDRYIYRWIGV